MMRFSSRSVCLFGLALLGCVLTGCLGQPSPHTQWYILAAPEVPASTGALNGPRVSIGPVTLPGYLNRSGLFIRKDANSPLIKLTNVAQWSEPLDLGIARVLSATLSTRLAERRAAVFSFQYDLPADWRVFVNIIRFDGAPDASVRLEADWSVITAQGAIKRTGRFVQTRPAGARLGDMVQTQSALLEDFGAALADELRQVIRQGTGRAGKSLRGSRAEKEAQKEMPGGEAARPAARVPAGPYIARQGVCHACFSR